MFHIFKRYSSQINFHEHQVPSRVWQLVPLYFKCFEQCRFVLKCCFVSVSFLWRCLMCDFVFWCVISQRWISPPSFRLVSCAALTLTQSVSVLQIFMTSSFIQLVSSFVHRGTRGKDLRVCSRIFSRISVEFFLCASTCGETLMVMRFWRADAEAGLWVSQHQQKIS